MKKILLVDGHALLHRGFHAFYGLKSMDDFPTGAIFGFISILLTHWQKYKPDHIVVAWDTPGPTVRHSYYEQYKGTRKEIDTDLVSQIEPVRNFITALNIPIIEHSNYEADDMIGSFCLKYGSKYEIMILTGDVDELQLLAEHVSVTLLKSKQESITLSASSFKKDWGFAPLSLIDYKSFRGDSSDNIPGVKGIGDKIATELIKEYGSTEKVYEAIEKGTLNQKPRIIDLLVNGKEQAFLSKKLATIITDIAFDIDFSSKAGDFYLDTIIDLLHLYSINKFTTNLKNLCQKNLGSLDTIFIPKAIDPAISYSFKHKLITDLNSLKEILSKVKPKSLMALDTETTSIDTYEALIVGLSFCFNEKEAYYFAFTHYNQDKVLTITEIKEVLIYLHQTLKDKEINIVGHNIKYDLKVLKNYIEWDKAIFADTMIIEFLLDSRRRSQSLDNLANKYLNYEMMPISKLIGDNKKSQITFDQVDVEQASFYGAEDAWATFMIFNKQQELCDQNIITLGNECEWPLVMILANMEHLGVEVDRDFLNTLDQEISAYLIKIQSSIIELAGIEFNINSPRQLAHILYDVLALDSISVKKNKTGLSTNAIELFKLKGKHPIVDLIIEYRELNKLLNTYVQALPSYIKDDGRVHTNFSQTIAATGRLSSIEPNLQNIPIRTETGKSIRKAFRAKQGCLLVSLDYSQIELRIAAFLSGDQQMLLAFKDNQDIHAQTAAMIFSVALDQVSAEQRYQAKTINFGILYGMNVHGLSQATGMNYAQAKQFIEIYYASRPELTKYLALVSEQALKDGYVSTYFGRKRYLDELKSNNSIMRQAALRAAINHPIQGTSADLIKIAMIALENSIGVSDKLVLQVHDELVFEIPEEEIDSFSKHAASIMTKDIIDGLPLEVGVKIAKNWGAF